MAFDQTTRNRLARFVGQTRDLLTEEFTRQLQNDYGLDPSTGDVTELNKLPHLDDARNETARLLRETMEHYLAGSDSKGQKSRQEALDRIVREQAFTVLNRLCALRMAESRGLLMESIAEGYNSKGFQLYAQIAGASLGERGDAYRNYLFGLFDEFAIDLPVLFDRHSPQGRLFPRESILLQVLDQINQADIDALWAEDETIGWIYQYWNTKEERKAMRDASSAPRNSRELAVRNQFFTPRYVVEFLTDNTLGRIWYEMIQGQTRLKDQCRYLVRRPNEIFLQPGEAAPEQPDQDNLSQEELLQQPVYIPHRPIKDPREIRMLDPACGSMHFGLYSFDLFERIYEEAWDLGMESLHNDFPDKDVFLREVPRLIIERNIHGIDIDPRAVQIAGLSLWLRAQKSWHDLGVSAAQRPCIFRSNIVCAEPMPGSPELLEEFTKKLQPPLLGQLVEKVFAHMQLAGEAGSLLKIEEEITLLVKEAKELWQSRPEVEQMDLDLETKARQGSLRLDLSGITDEQFWKSVEERIYAALQTYAEQAEEGGNYQRSLFAGDAAQGFAFIDLCRKRYDAVVMNPPFGECISKKSGWIKGSYKKQPSDLYCYFVLRGVEFSGHNGCVGAITSASFKTYVDYEKFRTAFFTSGKIAAFVDLGWGVLDQAYVEACCYTLTPAVDSTLIPFIDLRMSDEKGGDLLEATDGVRIEALHWRDPRDFALLPDSPLIYWWSPARFRFFASLTSLGSFCSVIGKGAGPHAIFYRMRWEVPPEEINLGKRWAPFSNGGTFSPFRREESLLLEWANSGALVKGYILQKYPYLDGNTGWNVQLEHLYGTAGLTYGKKTTNFSTQYLPEGFIFSFERMGVFPEDGCDIEWLCAYLNSQFVSWFLNTTCGLHKNPPYLRKLPVANFSAGEREQLASLTRDGWRLKQVEAQEQETSTSFVVPGHHFRTGNFESGLDGTIWKQLNNTLQQIDNLVLSALELSEDDIKQGYDLEERLSEDSVISGYKIFSEILSYGIGAVFGRWDVRFSTGERPKLVLPDPLARLPVCPPGQLQNDQGLPLNKEDVERLKKEGQWDYPIEIAWSGILVDDSSHPLDVETCVHQVLQTICENRWEAIEQEACEMLGVKVLRDYFRKPSGFFGDHLKCYSKSRRQAPIYWPLSTASGKYTLWIYYHRLTDQMLYTAINDFVDPKLSQVTEELSSLRNVGDRTRQQEKTLEELADSEIELTGFRDELLRVAAFWKPNLNDGVLITASPLWKLFGLKPWQKKLKQMWNKLEKGDYDWAHLALSIWPDRVVRASRKDRSYAIAHDLEDLLWEEVEVEKRGRGGRVRKKIEWRPRELTEDELEAIIEEVKAR